MSQDTTSIIRIRLIGRRWTLSFLKDLSQSLIDTLGEDPQVRINSFIAQPSRIPITDVDVFTNSLERVSKVRRVIEDVLEKHGYPLGRLLTVKRIEIAGERV